MSVLDEQDKRSQASRSMQDSMFVSETVASATRARAASSIGRKLSTYHAWAIRSMPAPTSGAEAGAQRHSIRFCPVQDEIPLAVEPSEGIRDVCAKILQRFSRRCEEFHHAGQGGFLGEVWEGELLACADSSGNHE